MKQKKVKTNVEIFMGMRKSWGNVNPVTKVIPNKKKSQIPIQVMFQII